ncbi:MAG: glycoside hydrolase family 13 protein [Ginsengibacter sp.]
MKNPALQLMIHGKSVSQNKLSITYPGVTVREVHKVENPNYIFVDLDISKSAKRGVITICIGDHKIPFELKKRRLSENGVTRIKGVTSADLIYFLMPDRFSNGDPSNDSIPGMKEQVYGRNQLKGRHGGDFKGVENHLNYLKDLGITTIWMTPVIVNDMARESYHGYAFTNNYQIDSRFGGDEGYMHLIENAHSKGMKIIQDAVYNHFGISHVTVEDLPMKDWLNQWPKYQNTSFKDPVLFDPYASNIDKKIMTDGWFTPKMPDLNQRNPFVANYLIQHAIWTTENFGIDGWRIDTYAYCDRDFMNKCNKALLDQYPQLGIFAETWVHGMVNQAYFVSNNLNIPYKSNLPGVTDFQIHFTIDDVLNSKAPEGKVYELYNTLAKDFVYKDAYKNCIFLDNHDMNRFFSTINNNLDRFKIGINWLLTLRGIPELYYGTEILMDGTTNPSDALVRKDFPGGWPDDPKNKFIESGRTKNENEAFKYIKILANYRLTSSAIKTGKLMQYVPEGGNYVYFRYDNKSTILIASNTGAKESVIKMDRFAERTKGFSKMKNIFNGEIKPLNDFTLLPDGNAIFEFMK